MNYQSSQYEGSIHLKMLLLRAQWKYLQMKVGCYGNIDGKYTSCSLVVTHNR